MTKDEILKKHEDLNEYHFHQVDREFILQAMQEYADQQLRLCGVSRSEPKEKDLIWTVSDQHIYTEVINKNGKIKI